MPNNVFRDSDFNRNPLGESIVESKTNADAVSGVVTFEELIWGIEIYNKDTTNDGVFVVNGITITVPAGKSYRSPVGGKPLAKTVTVSGSTSYEVRRII